MSFLPSSLPTNIPAPVDKSMLRVNMNCTKGLLILMALTAFSSMRLPTMIASTTLPRINAEMEQRNQELQQAYRLAREADERKTSFIQNMTHQVRTPLNIIIGFAQVIATNYPDMSETELTELFDHMKSSVKVVARIVHMLTATSVTNTST